MPSSASLLHPTGEPAPLSPSAPACLADLHLDHVFTAILGGRAEYHLEEELWSPPGSAAAVAYRQEAMRDIEREAVGAAVREFTDRMRTVRGGLARSAGYEHPVQQHTTHLETAHAYVAAVRGFADRLAAAEPQSRAMTSLATRLADLTRSVGFAALADDAARTQAALDGVVYRLHVSNDRVRVTRATGHEHDYSAEVLAVFDRFGSAAEPRPPSRVDEAAAMNHVEEGVADRVAALYPQEFGLLEQFATRHHAFVDPGVRAADRELQFHLAGLWFAARLRAAGVPVCWPEVSETDRSIDLVASCDPALALEQPDQLVLNDAQARGDERILVVTGPNQGGKTTFARMLGSVIFLASLGFPVPGQRARLPLPDHVLTHFARAEDLADLRGALDDDLVRLRDILAAATPRSLVILNEVFTSTTVSDAAQLSRRTLDLLRETGCTGVWVTFLTELAELPGVVSLVSQVAEDDPTVRTFRVVRQPAGGPTWAETLALAQGLDRESLRRRLAR